MTETCGTCKSYIAVFSDVGVCPCAYWLLSMSFDGIKASTPISESACEGDSYQKREQEQR